MPKIFFFWTIRVEYSYRQIYLTNFWCYLPRYFSHCWGYAAPNYEAKIEGEMTWIVHANWSRNMSDWNTITNWWKRIFRCHFPLDELDRYRGRWGVDRRNKNKWDLTKKKPNKEKITKKTWNSQIFGPWSLSSPTFSTFFVFFFLVITLSTQKQYRPFLV